MRSPQEGVRELFQQPVQVWALNRVNPCSLKAYVWYGVSHASIVHVYLVWMNFHDPDVTN